jgi:hypothetical protein
MYYYDVVFESREILHHNFGAEDCSATRVGFRKVTGSSLSLRTAMTKANQRHVLVHARCGGSVTKVLGAGVEELFEAGFVEDGNAEGLSFVEF